MARADWMERLTLVRLARRMPTWMRISLSVLSIVLGAVIVLRPTTALDLLALLVGGGMVLTGILEATGRVDEGERRWRGALAIGWIVLGVFVLAWPGLTVRAIAVITGLLLLAAGAAGVTGAFAKGRGWDSRIADAAFGGTGVIFGILALVWPDITLLVVAVVFVLPLGTVVVAGLAGSWTGPLPSDLGFARYGTALSGEDLASLSVSLQTAVLAGALAVTAGTWAALAARDVRVLVPITLPDLDLDWCDAGDPDRTTLGLDAVLAADVVLAPGLSVDGGGTRLGQGGGCYDRVLARLAAAGRGDVPVVTLLHPGELLADPLPLEPHDRAVDAVVTADGCTALPVSTPPWTADPPGTPA